MPAEQAPPSELEERATTIVLIGRFNPRIFQPMWFDAKGLLSEADVDPQSLVMTDGFAAFQTELFGLLCAQERCQFTTTATTPSPDVIRDLVLGTFTLLKETPIWECGINHVGHIPPSVRRWDDIAAQFGDPQRTFVVLDDQQLQTIEVRAQRDDEREGSRTVQLQPSTHLEGGVWFALNDHVAVRSQPDVAETVRAAEAMTVLENIWDPSVGVADDVHRLLAPSK